MLQMIVWIFRSGVGGVHVLPFQPEQVAGMDKSAAREVPWLVQCLHHL